MGNVIAWVSESLECLLVVKYCVLKDMCYGFLVRWLSAMYTMSE